MKNSGDSDNINEFYLYLNERLDTNNIDIEKNIYYCIRNEEFIKKYNYYKKNQLNFFKKEQLELKEEYRENFNRLCHIIDLYFTFYKALYNLKKIIDNPEKFTFNQSKMTVAIIRKKYYEIVKQCKSIKNFKECIEEILEDKIYIDSYNILRNKVNFNIDKDKYFKSKELIKEVLSFTKNCDKLFLDEWDVISYKSYFKIREFMIKNNIDDEEITDALECIRESFYISLINDESIKVYNDFSIVTIKNLSEEINDMYNDYEIKPKSSKDEAILKSEEEINKLLLLLKQYKNDNNNYYQIYYNLIAKEHFKLDDLIDNRDLFNNYVINNITNDKEKEEYIKTFRETINIGINFEISTKSIYKVILSNEDKKDINKEISFYILYNKGLTPSKLKSKLQESNLFCKAQDEVNKYCEEYSGYFLKHREQEKEEQEQHKNEEELKNLPKYEQIINEFITSDFYSIKEYCTLNNITENEFKYKVEILKKFESPIYVIYEKFVTKKNSQRYAVLHAKVSALINAMEESNGNFTLLDYYDYINFSFDETKKLLKNNFTPQQVRLFAQFCAKYRNQAILTRKQIDELNIKYPIKRDEKGNVIQFYDVTDEDKNQVQLMLKEKNIPITISTFRLMLDKYVEENILSKCDDNKNQKNI